MIEIRGPDNIKRIIMDGHDAGKASAVNEFKTDAKTLKEALDSYCSYFNSKYRLYNGDIEELPIKKGEEKYFYYASNNPKSKIIDEVLVDIHVIRESEEICPKQNLDFELVSGDLITIGMLAC
jgi:hypothetical protein